MSRETEYKLVQIATAALQARDANEDGDPIDNELEAIKDLTWELEGAANARWNGRSKRARREFLLDALVRLLTEIDNELDDLQPKRTAAQALGDLIAEAVTQLHHSDGSVVRVAAEATILAANQWIEKNK